MDQLTPREYQVAMLVARGLCNKELGLSHCTVKLHMHNICRNLDVKSRYVLIARDQQWFAARPEDSDRKDSPLA
jgi:DNA-binding NarL/FixJ family response regulator